MEQVLIFIAVLLILIYVGLRVKKLRNKIGLHINNSSTSETMSEGEQETVMVVGIDEPKKLDIERNVNNTNSEQLMFSKKERVAFFKVELLKVNGVGSVVEARELMATLLTDIEKKCAAKGEDRMVVPSLEALETQSFCDNGISILLNGHRVFINSNGAIRIINIKKGTVFLEKDNMNNIPFKDCPGWKPIMPDVLKRMRQRAEA